MFRRIDDQFWAAPQIGVADVEQAARDGVVLIVNNRPDGEDPAADQGDAIAAAAEAAGVAYLAIPIDHGGFSAGKVQAMADALAAHPGLVLGYCRSGTRSTNLWALARASTGADPDLLIVQAANAGYDLSALRPTLAAVSARG